MPKRFNKSGSLGLSLVKTLELSFPSELQEWLPWIIPCQTLDLSLLFSLFHIIKTTKICPLFLPFAYHFKNHKKKLWFFHPPSDELEVSSEISIN